MSKTSIEPERGLGADYFAYLDPDTRETLDSGDQFIAVRMFDTGEGPRVGFGDERERRAPRLKARCRLQPPFPEDKPGKAEARLDQTLRNALGMPAEPRNGDTVDLSPLFRSRAAALKERLGDSVLRRRYLFMRVRKADPSDMEKRLVRIPADSFHLLGVSPGEKLVISAPKELEGGGYEEEHYPIQAFPVTTEVLERQRQSDGGLYDRYPNPEKLFDVTPDLCSIYLDQKARQKLDVRTLEVVRVRRSDADAFLQRTRAFSLTIAASAIAIINIFPIHQTVLNGLKVLAAALVLAVGVLILNLRASAYGKPM